MVMIERRGSTLPVLGEATVQDLRESLLGELVLPGDPTYDTQRREFNAMIDRYPALIVRPVVAANVVSALAFARSHDIPVAVPKPRRLSPGRASWRRRLSPSRLAGPT